MSYKRNECLKRSLSWLLILIMLFGSLGTTAFGNDKAEEEESAVVQLQPDDISVTPFGHIAAAGETDGALSGDAAYVSAANVSIAASGTMPFDAESAPGNDTSATDAVIRSYDTLTYDLEYWTQSWDGNQAFDSGYIWFQYFLPAGKDEATFNLEAMGLSENYSVVYWWPSDEPGNKDYVGGGNSGYWYHDGVEDGMKYQTLTIKQWVNTGFIPGSATRSLVINVHGMSNGATIEPRCKIWLDGNAIGSRDNYQMIADTVCLEHDAAEVQSPVVPAVTVSAALKLNVQLKMSTKSSTMRFGEFDFDIGETSGDKAALHYDDGLIEGDLRTFGLTLQLYNDSAAKGLRGLELPDGDITFTLSLTSSFIRSGDSNPLDVTSNYTPRIYTYMENEYDDAKNEVINGRAMEDVLNTRNAQDAAPYNSGGSVWTNERCYDGGDWYISESGTPGEYLVTINNYRFNENIFPREDAAFSGTHYYTGSTLENIGCFSAAALQILTPVKVDGGPHIGNGDLTLTVCSGNLTATSVTNQSLSSQGSATDDTVMTSVNTSQGVGNYYTVIQYSPRTNSPYMDSNAQGQGYGYGSGNSEDWLFLGQTTGAKWGVSYHSANANDNKPAAVLALLKYEAEAFEALDISHASILTPGYQNTDCFTTEFYYAAKPDGSGWSNDQEMGGSAEELPKLTLEDLVYFKSLADLHAALPNGVCVGVLGVMMPKSGMSNEVLYQALTGAAENTDLTFHIPLTVQGNSALAGNVFMICQEVRMWNYRDYAALTQLPTVTQESGGSYIISGLSSGEGAPTLEQRNYYNRTVYAENGGYLSGGNDGYLHGDSVLIVGYAATVEVEVSQHVSHGDSTSKGQFQLDDGQQVIDYTLCPSLEVGDHLRDTATYVVDWVSITSVLPAGLSYQDGSARFGGTYHQPVIAGRQGSVDGGIPLSDQGETNQVILRGEDGQDYEVSVQFTIGVDPVTLASTLTWTLWDVPLCCTLPQLFYSVEISNEVSNLDTFENVVRIRADGDQRSIHEDFGNISTVSSMVLKQSSTTFYKRAAQRYYEQGTAFEYTITMSNTSDSGLQNYVILDIFPSNFDSYNSSFEGDLFLDHWLIYATGYAEQAGQWPVYYTTDAAVVGTYAQDHPASDIAAGASFGDAVNWKRATLETSDGGSTYEVHFPEESRGRITGVAVLAALNSFEVCKMETSFSAPDAAGGSRFSNALSCGGGLIYDFCYYVGRSVSGRVWHDVNQNGVQDGEHLLAEPGVSGITVALLTMDGESACHVDGAAVSPVVTDELGVYTFSDLPAGAYQVRLGSNDELAPYVLTARQVGDDDAVDSDAQALEQENEVLKTAVITGDALVLPDCSNILSRIYESGHHDCGLYYPDADLTIGKQVTGGGGDVTKAWQFTLTLENDTAAPMKDAYAFTKTSGGTETTGTFALADNSMQKDDGCYTIMFSLAHGESMTLHSLSDGTKYSATETIDASEGYITTVNGMAGADVTGELYLGNPETVLFQNAKKAPPADSGDTEDTESKDKNEEPQPEPVPEEPPIEEELIGGEEPEEEETLTEGEDTSDSTDNGIDDRDTDSTPFEVPPEVHTPGNSLVYNENGSFTELDEDGVPLGSWVFDQGGWVFIPDAELPLNPYLPQTGSVLPVILLIFGINLLAAGLWLARKRQEQA